MTGEHLTALIAHAKKSKSKKQYRLAGTWVVVDEEVATKRGTDMDYFTTVAQAYSGMFTKSMMDAITFMRTNTGNYHGLGYGQIIVYDMETNEVVFNESRPQ